ncbi:MAG TPA: lipid-binding SYLF domain-containing protein [Stellaceae bacterium]|nr:lipid-binding SYLF domain-containing protein [Stellaceae bacterium]
MGHARIGWSGWLLLCLCAAVAGCQTGPATPPQARVSEEQQLVDQARLAVVNLRSGSSPVAQSINGYLPRARGVLIFPDLLRAGFIIGGSGGTGVLLARTPSGWSDPAFYFAGSGSFGLQIGAEGGNVMFVVMNDGSLKKIASGTGVNLGGDVSLAVGPYGGGAQGATTTNLGADLVAFSAQQGVFGGAAVQGGTISPRQGWNDAYYRPGATPQAIIAGEYHNHGARGLIEALAVARTR